MVGYQLNSIIDKALIYPKKAPYFFKERFMSDEIIDRLKSCGVVPVIAIEKAADAVPPGRRPAGGRP